MTLSYRDALAIPLLLFYAPCFLSSTALIRRHGWRQSWCTWFVLCTFALTRIAYASLQLAAHTHPAAQGLRTAAATLAVDGLSPLLFMSLGLVHRLRAFVLRKSPQAARGSLLSPAVLRLQELLVVAGFLCASIGYRGAGEEQLRRGIVTHAPVLKAAAALFVVACAGIVSAAVQICSSCQAWIPREEKKVVLVLGGGLPLLCVRMVYLAVDVLGDRGTWSAISGSVTLFLLLGLLPEVLMSVGHLYLGFSVRVIPDGEWQSMQEVEREDTREST